MNLISELDAEGGDINISEMSFEIEDMFLGVYQNSNIGNSRVTTYA